MKLIAYLRTSKEEQTNGIPAQRHLLSRYADLKNHEIVEWLEDHASGKDMDRPGMRTALEMLSQGEAEGLAVAKLDRVSRSVPDFAGLLATAKKQEWAFIAIDLDVDTSTPNGALVANVMMSIAQWERSIISQRTSEALQAKKRQGARLGRPVQTPIAVRRRVQRQRDRGWTYARIAERLNRDGVPTAQGGECWRESTVRNLLRTIALDRQAQQTSANGR
jgi:DNA invertase Pin-like site-specific DNA recombinase